MKNLAFHSFLGGKIIILPILTTSPIHFSLKRWENLRFELMGVTGLNHSALLASTIVFTRTLPLRVILQKNIYIVTWLDSSTEILYSPLTWRHFFKLLFRGAAMKLPFAEELGAPLGTGDRYLWYGTQVGRSASRWFGLVKFCTVGPAATKSLGQPFA